VLTSTRRRREDVLAAVIHLLAIDAHVAEAAGPPPLNRAGNFVRSAMKLSTMGGWIALDEDVLAEAAPVAPGPPSPAAAACNGRRVGYCAPPPPPACSRYCWATRARARRPCGGRAHAAVEEEDVV